MPRQTITTNGTTTVSLQPHAFYIGVVEGDFSGAKVKIQTPGGVKYLPYRDGEDTLTGPDAAEFRAVKGSAEIVVTDAEAGTNIEVTIDKFVPKG